MTQPSSITVSPAYGRDYKSSSDAVKAWQDGVDFLLETISGLPAGRYCSTRDFTEPGTEIRIRYNRKQDVTLIQS